MSSQRMVEEGVCDALELVPIPVGTKRDTETGTERTMDIFNSDNSFESLYDGGKQGMDGNGTCLKVTFLGYVTGVGAELYIHNQGELDRSIAFEFHEDIDQVLRLHDSRGQESFEADGIDTSHIVVNRSQTNSQQQETILYILSSINTDFLSISIFD
ncbi:hypothetical protein Tco_1350659 [Tanacetum coccineum]